MLKVSRALVVLVVRHRGSKVWVSADAVDGASGHASGHIILEYDEASCIREKTSIQAVIWVFFGG